MEKNVDDDYSLEYTDFMKTKSILEDLIGCSRIELIPDSISESCEKSGAKIEWRAFDGNWEEIEDKTIYNSVLKDAEFKGKVIIITEASFLTAKKAFCLDFSFLPEFIKKHRVLFKERFFDGDVIIFSQYQRKIFIFHHEGVYTVIDLPPSSSD